jgi:RHS repeat-associated protein
MAGRTNEAFAGMRKGLQEIRRQEQTPIEIHFYHCDHLGTPIALTDRNGQIVWAARHDPWGNVKEEFNPHGIEQDIRLPGQHYDKETGLYYNRHRYYDPKIGSYINHDPLGLDGGINLYGYPKNPMNWGDPTGLQQACVVNFPKYPVEYTEGKTSTWLGGHGGVLTYNSTGETLYFEYGRYNPNLPGIVGEKLPANEGNIRQVLMPDLKIDKNGNPTKESMEKLKQSLSTKSGKGTAANLVCKSADPQKVLRYVNNIANNKDREKYRWNPFNPNHCRSFAEKASEAGQK